MSDKAKLARDLTDAFRAYAFWSAKIETEKAYFLGRYRAKPGCVYPEGWDKNKEHAEQQFKRLLAELTEESSEPQESSTMKKMVSKGRLEPFTIR